MFGKKKNEAQATHFSVPVLCKFWQEDGVWNACAEHLPVAVFGDTVEEARENLCNAVISHVQSVAEAGRIEELVTLLKRRAEDHMLVNEIVADSLISRMMVPVNQELVADCV